MKKKKKKLKQLIQQQSNTITKLSQENRYLRDKFEESRDFIIATIAGIVGGGK